MTHTQVTFTQQHADELAVKLQSFYDALSPDEKPVMAALLSQAEGINDVSGFGLGVRLVFAPIGPDWDASAVPTLGPVRDRMTGEDSPWLAQSDISLRLVIRF